MKQRASTSLVILFLLFCYLEAEGQEGARASDLGGVDLQEIHLPPLPELFENARNSAALDFYEARKEAQQRMVKSVKREWMRNIKVMGGYQYGVMGVNNAFSDQNSPVLMQVSTINQHFYNIGVAAAIPLDEFFDRGNKIKRFKLETKESEAEAERWMDEQKLKIIESYSFALQHLAVLDVKAQAMTLASAQYKMAEIDFANGKIDTAGLGASKSVETNAIVDYQQTKTQLSIALLQLEVLSRTKIISK